MSNHPTILERAFELAQSGKFQRLTDLRNQLKAEGYVAQQIEGRALLRQLRALMDRKAATLPRPPR